MRDTLKRNSFSIVVVGLTLLLAFQRLAEDDPHGWWVLALGLLSLVGLVLIERHHRAKMREIDAWAAREREQPPVP